MLNDNQKSKYQFKNDYQFFFNCKMIIDKTIIFYAIFGNAEDTDDMITVCFVYVV